MLRHEPRDEVVHFVLPACDRHAAIVGEYKAKSRGSAVMLSGRANASVPHTSRAGNRYGWCAARYNSLKIVWALPILPSYGESDQQQSRQQHRASRAPGGASAATPSGPDTEEWRVIAGHGHTEECRRRRPRRRQQVRIGSTVATRTMVDGAANPSSIFLFCKGESTEFRSARCVAGRSGTR